MYSKDPAHENTWRLDMVPWSERNTEAFAGLHNKGKRILLVFDEASAIPDLIWEVSEGALTDASTQIIWAVFGNPTRNKGRFRECFKGGRFEHRWISRAVDSREVTLTNKTQIAKWITDYGEDSDFVRVRVRGSSLVLTLKASFRLRSRQRAAKRPPTPSQDPIILGVDVGRFGDDPLSFMLVVAGTQFPFRLKSSSAPTPCTAARVAAAALRWNAIAVMVDSGGVGGGVVDRLQMLRIPSLRLILVLALTMMTPMTEPSTPTSVLRFGVE
ncbi:MAG: hypothetical protein IPH10_10810 [bacterium]|nr:hypothetical protein [bacterium]